MKKKIKKNFNKNQQSFFFEDYLSTNQTFKKEKYRLINEVCLHLIDDLLILLRI